MSSAPLAGSTAPGARRVLLVGGGHAHLLVLRAWCARPFPGAAVTLVSDRASAVYSGMVPGFVAGEYTAEQVRIPLEALAARAGARFVLSPAHRVLADEECVELASGERLAYDVASLDVGSSVAGLERRGVREHALATRPMADFVARADALLARAGAAARPLRVAVVGAGAGGVELALTLHARLARGPASAALTLVEAGPALLPGHARGLVRRAARRLREAGVEVRLSAPVEAVHAGRAELRDGATIFFDALVWVAGAAPPTLLSRSRLPLDARGFLRVRATLQVPGHDRLLAAGDTATLDAHPDTPKAGVYAVRQAPVLRHNLEALLAGGPLQDFRPQRDTLILLNAGDGTALGAKWGWSFEGRWVRRWKDHLDRRFVASFAG